MTAVLDFMHISHPGVPNVVFGVFKPIFWHQRLEKLRKLVTKCTFLNIIPMHSSATDREFGVAGFKIRKKICAFYQISKIR